MILCLVSNYLVVGNTQFRKRKWHLVTYKLSSQRTQLDYILFHKSFLKAVSDFKMIPYTHEYVQQQHLVTCNFTVPVKKQKFTPCICTM